MLLLRQCSASISTIAMELLPLPICAQRERAQCSPSLDPKPPNRSPIRPPCFYLAVCEKGPELTLPCRIPKINGCAS